MENTTIIHAPAHADAHKKALCAKKEHAFNALHTLAEVEEGEFRTADECDNMKYMLEKVMKYGTYMDNVNALVEFIKYMHAYTELEDI